MNAHAALIITAKKWEQLKSSSTDKWINKLWHIYTMAITWQ